MADLVLFRRMLVGVLIGCVAGAASVPTDLLRSGTAAMSVVEPPLAFADNGCGEWGGSRFVGSNWGPGTLPTNVDGAKVQISTVQPAGLCGGAQGEDDSYWVMVGAPSGTCSGGAYAQTGWTVSDTWSPKAFYEVSRQQPDPTTGECDNGSIYPGYNISYGDTWMWQAQIMSVPASTCQTGLRAYFFMSGLQIGAKCIDWSNGNQVIMSQEDMNYATHVGSENFRSASYCTTLNSCTMSSLKVGCTGYRGCVETHNDYGCFAQRQNMGSYYNGFDVWDQRDTGTGTQC